MITGRYENRNKKSETILSLVHTFRFQAPDWCGRMQTQYKTQYKTQYGSMLGDRIENAALFANLFIIFN